MARFERSLTRLPCRLARVSYWREVDFVGNLNLPFALQPSPSYLFPGNDVIDEFPDAVRVRDGLAQACSAVTPSSNSCKEGPCHA